MDDEEIEQLDAAAMRMAGRLVEQLIAVCKTPDFAMLVAEEMVRRLQVRGAKTEAELPRGANAGADRRGPGGGATRARVPDLRREHAARRTAVPSVREHRSRRPASPGQLTFDSGGSHGDRHIQQVPSRRSR